MNPQMILLLVSILMIPAISVAITLTVVELVKVMPPVAKTRHRRRKKRR